MWTVAAFISAGSAQVDWLGLGLAATRRSVCIHQMNRVNSRSDLDYDDNTINTIAVIIIIILIIYIPQVIKISGVKN